MWLRHAELATQDETSEPVKLMTPEIAQLKVAGLDLEVQLQRLQILGPATLSSRASELGVGILQRLEHVPVSSVGMNRHMHFKAPDDAAVHTVGHRLVPKEIWKAFVDDPLTRTVTVQGPRKGGDGSTVYITVERSRRFKAPDAGVYVNVNEHHKIEPETTSVALSHLKQWHEIQGAARTLGEELLKRCLAS